MTALALLASTFALVFALGLQSQLVNNGHYASAFCNSLLIGGCNLVLFKLAPNATGLEIAAYLAGGPFGIVASMAFYRWLKRQRHLIKVEVTNGSMPLCKPEHVFAELRRARKGPGQEPTTPVPKVTPIRPTHQEP
jgi:hypothetical protein